MPIPSQLAFGDSLPKVEQLNYLAGDYWYRMFPAQEQLAAITGAVRQEFRQMCRELESLSSVGSFETAQAYHEETFWPLVIPVDQVRKSPVRYGEGYIYGSGDSNLNVVYGQSIPGAWEVPVPEAIKDAAAVSDRIVRPSHFFTQGMELFFHQERSQRWLQIPFDPREFAQGETTSDGKPAIVLWLYMARFDRRDTARGYGGIVNLNLATSDEYLQAVRATLSSYVRGSSEYDLRRLLAAAVSQPVAEPGEVVVELLLDRVEKVVITDRRTVYGKAGDAPVVSAGDVLQEGDFFFDSVKLTDGRAGTYPWLDTLIIPTRITGADREITITAGSWPVVEVDGDAKVLFSVNDEDNVLFADWMNRGRGLRHEILHYLSDGGTVDMTAQLPPNVDLIALLADRWLQRSVSVSRLRTSSLSEDGRHLLRLVREVIPPWLTHLIQFEGAQPPGWDEPDACRPPVSLFF